MAYSFLEKMSRNYPYLSVENQELAAYFELRTLKDNGKITPEQEEELEYIIEKNPKIKSLEDYRIKQKNKDITPEEFEKKYSETWESLMDEISKHSIPSSTLSDRAEEYLAKVEGKIIGTKAADRVITLPTDVPAVSAPTITNTEPVVTATPVAASVPTRPSISVPTVTLAPPTTTIAPPTVTVAPPDPTITPPVEDIEPIEKDKVLDLLYRNYEKNGPFYPDDDVIDDVDKPPLRIMDSDFDFDSRSIDITEEGLELINQYYESKTGTTGELIDLNTLTYLNNLEALGNNYEKAIIEREGLGFPIPDPVSMAPARTVKESILKNEQEKYLRASLRYNELASKGDLTEEEKRELDECRKYLLLIKEFEAKNIVDLERALISVRNNAEKKDVTPMDLLIRDAYESEAEKRARKISTGKRVLEGTEKEIFYDAIDDYAELLKTHKVSSDGSLDISDLTEEEKIQYTRLKAYEHSCEDRYNQLCGKGDLTEEEKYDKSRCNLSLYWLAVLEARHIDDLEEIVEEAKENEDLLPAVKEIKLKAYSKVVDERKPKTDDKASDVDADTLSDKDKEEPASKEEPPVVDSTPEPVVDSEPLDSSEPEEDRVTKVKEELAKLGISTTEELEALLGSLLKEDKSKTEEAPAELDAKKEEITK